ncbi:invasion associated locus B family protein [Rhodophyticola sp. CCM32]|uniref:invasion associated locus B family protein n=1 Tax=Rhodophyticola sp. CCM32 TaxID=2916397 RepID=UPI00107FCA82|nr:invasion associated locus B family protein [Rhodophyticola sp. CCM32]QBY00610.1 invasion associated locus B family protein [Rhodophyticola sp. CCM32]
MKSASPVIPALLALMLACPALAQETTPEEAPAAEEPAADAPAGENTDGDVAILSLGEPVENTGPGSTYIAETHGDWEIRCIRVEEGQQEPCQMYQLLSDEGDNPVAEFNLFDVPDQEQLIAGATIVTPLDTLLTPQMRMSIDGGQARQYPFSFCQAIGCFVRIGLTENDVSALRSGGSATISIVPLPAPDQLVDLTLSLTGFTAAFTALEARAAEPAE